MACYKILYRIIRFVKTIYRQSRKGYEEVYRNFNWTDDFNP